MVRDTDTEIAEPISVARRRAFSLVELLVVFVVVAVLIGLAVPSLFGARHRGVEAKCLAHAKNAVVSLAAYASEFRDALPYGGDVKHEVAVGESGTANIGGTAGLGGGEWSILFPEGWSGDHWDPGRMCPRQPRYDPAASWGPPRQDGVLMFPTLCLSNAVWLDAATLRVGAEWNDLRPRPNAMSDVVFPAAKVSFFEQLAWCAQGPGVEFWKDLGQTPGFDSSVATFDGAVRRMKQNDGLPAVVTMPFGGTLDGVRGRDLK
jgi:type II secretory pathway pseudopilin PulG